LLNVIFFILWVVLGCYCLVCVFIPEIRFMTWRGSSVKLGALSYLCLSWILGSPLLFATGVLPNRYGKLLYASMVFAVIMMFLGWKVDQALDPDR
jgi:hypothetical protein